MADEDEEIKDVALRNASSILKARRRAEQDLLLANSALERKSEELARSLAMMKATLDSATDGILVIDGDLQVTTFNQKFTEMWRLPESLLQTQDHVAITDMIAANFANADEYTRRVGDIYRGAAPTSFDVLTLSDGRVIERQSQQQMIDGRVVGRVWNFRDVSAQRKAEEERKGLLESERSARNLAERMSALKDDFLSTLSHELRTPLSAIMGWTQILRRGTNTPEDLQKGLDTIERNSRLQVQLIDDLLDMNRIASGKVRLDIQPVAPIVFIEAALQTARPAAEAKGVRVERMLDPSVGPIPGDPSRLQQVMSNLLSNAIKFTPRGGKVQVFLARVDSHVEITVADSGIGIKPDFVAHVFERFRQADASTTRKYGGLGLGLAIVKNLVELHGGSVRAASAGVDKGASFCVHLPVPLVQGYATDEDRRHPRAYVPLATPFAALDLSGLTILVVDDDADGRELVRRVLVECQAEVLVAANAAEAIGVVESVRPDVMISDIGMPEVDGFELLRRIRALGQERGGRVPAIALTAFARSQDRTQALHAGFAAHLTKPVESPELLATVASVAGRTG